MVAHIFYFKLLNRLDYRRGKQMYVVVNSRKLFKSVQHCRRTCAHQQRSPARDKCVFSGFNSHCRLSRLLRLFLGRRNNRTLAERNACLFLNQLDLVHAFGISETFLDRTLLGKEAANDFLP